MLNQFAAALGIACCVALAGPASENHREAAGPWPDKPLAVGTLAPRFDGIADTGDRWDSDTVVGNKVLVVVFFPGDFLSASVRQARVFMEDLAELGDRPVELVAISGDSVATHQRFKEHHALSYRLLSDEDGGIARLFGVRTTMGGTVNNPVDKLGPVVRKLTHARRYFAVDLKGTIVETGPRIARLTDVDIVFELLARDFWWNREDKEPVWIPRHDRHWKRILSRQQYLVTRKQHTERPFSGEHNGLGKRGHYRCIGCGLILFASTTKFRSGTGWPSFWNPAAADRLAFAPDRSDGTLRTEVKCRRCDAHLGHVFGDGPPPTGHRYCINSAALALDTAAGN